MPALTNEQVAIVEKVKKLLALANGNANEHEAEAASAKAMDLLAAYNLSMHTVDGTRKDGRARSDTKRKGGLYAWQRQLWNEVAKLNFCMYWSIKGLKAGSTYEHRLLGSEVNVVSTEVMADYLQSTVERLAQEWAKQRGYKSVFVREAIAYREGMAAGLSARLVKIRWEREEAEKKARANTPTGTGLILADVAFMEEDLNNDHLYGYEPGTHAQRRAERAARQAELLRQADERLAAHKKWAEENPEEAAAQKAETDKWMEDRNAQWAKKADAAARRRAKNAGKPGYDDEGYPIRYRALSAAEQRQRLDGFYDGHYDSTKVNLDKQIDEEDRTDQRAIR